MKVSILGVFVGGVVDVVSSTLVGLPFALYSTFKLDALQRTGPHAAEAVSATIHANLPLYSAELVAGLLCSILGGYVAAAIAKRHERLNGTLSCYLCVGMSIPVIFLGLDKNPLWIQVILLIASPAMALLGGDIRLRKRLAAIA